LFDLITYAIKDVPNGGYFGTGALAVAALSR